MHQVVTAQLAAKRSGTQSTKTRSEVRGGGAKPWKQKGTGRARAGSIRAPQWRGGGVALGPKPRTYDQRTPKKMKRLALRSACPTGPPRTRSSSSTTGASTPRGPRHAVAALVSLGVSGRAAGRARADRRRRAWKSFRNVAGCPRDHPGRAQHLRRAGERLRRLHRGDAALQRARSRPTRRPHREGPPRRHPPPGREREVLRPARHTACTPSGRPRRPPSPRSATPSRPSGPASRSEGQHAEPQGQDASGTAAAPPSAAGPTPSVRSSPSSEGSDQIDLFEVK